MIKLIKYVFLSLVIVNILHANTNNAPLKKEEHKKVVPTPTKGANKAEQAKLLELNRLIDQLQRQYNNTKSASMFFSQSYSHSILPLNESAGQVFYKQQNMKWHYKQPADRERIFYIQGKKFTYHLLSDNIAYTHDCFEQDTLSASITFLWGKGKIKESFNVSFLNDNKLRKDLRWIKLIPKENQAAVKSIALGIDKTSPVVVESIVIDQNDGQNHFKFSELKINPLIADDVFLFKPTKNIRMEKMPHVQCLETKAPAPKKTPAQPIKKTAEPNKAPAK